MTLEAEIIVDLAVVMTIASAVTFVFERFKQPIVLGYIVAGVLIGPYTPPFSLVTRVEVWSVFAEIGVVLLLFAVGLEFPIGKLRKIGRATIYTSHQQRRGVCNSQESLSCAQ